MIRKFYETEGLEMKGANTPHPSTPAGKEEADSVIDRDSLDTNCLLFPIAVKKWWDNDTQCWGYTNEEYNISGYGKTEKEAYDMFLDCVSDVLVFVPPSPQSEQAGEKVGEEAAGKYADGFYSDGSCMEHHRCKTDFLAGARWQQSLPDKKGWKEGYMAAMLAENLRDELIKKQKEYISFLGNECARLTQYAGTHGMVIDISIFRRGEMFRNDISDLTLKVALSTSAAPDTVQGQEELWEEVERLIDDDSFTEHNGDYCPAGFARYRFLEALKLSFNLKKR